MRAVRRLAGEHLRLDLFELHRLPIRRIEPPAVIAVLLELHRYGPGLLYIDDVLDLLKRQTTAVFRIEKGLEFPVPRAFYELVPDLHLVGGLLVRDRRRRILAIHGGIPQTMAEGVGVNRIVRKV